MTEMEFFEAFDAERWNFTFMDEENPAQAILQVGLVAVFYIVDVSLPIRRKHIAEALGMFYEGGF